MTAQNIDKIGALFPNCITETVGEDGKMKKAINFEMLKQMLSDEVLDGDEAYEFTWVGKKAAIVEANKPIRKTLRPCKEESVNWDTTENLYIEGDNLEVLKLLQESYLGKVKMIYIDPPYNTGSDFIYRDDFKSSTDEYEEDLGVYDEDGNCMFKNTDSNGRFHSDWCSMIYSRLMLARNLLSDDGVIFISIDEHEIENLKKVGNEIFGEQNFVGAVIWERAFAPKNDAKYFSDSHDYIVVYARNLESFKIGKLPRTEEANARYKNPDNDPRGAWTADNLTVKTYSAAYDYPITTPGGRIVNPSHGSCWRVSRERFEKLVKDNRVYFGDDGNNVPRLKRFLSEIQDGMTPTTIWKFQDVGHNQEGRQELKKVFDGKGYFDGPKPTRLLNRILQIANTDKDSVVLDFFSGSATTAHAVMQLNAEDGGHRKFIMVQLPEKTDEKSEAYKAGYKNICEIGKERIRRAGCKIKEQIRQLGTEYRLAIKTLNDCPFEDEPNLQVSIVEENSSNEKRGYYIVIPGNNDEKTRIANREMANLLDIGFRVFKLDDSNMKDVFYSPADYDQNLLSTLESNIKEDRTDLDLLFGCLLEWGLPLSMPYMSEEIGGCTVHTYNDGDLIACFNDNIPDDVIKTIAKRQPLRAVFRDSSFNGSPAKINVTEVFKLLAPDTRVKVI